MNNYQLIDFEAWLDEQEGQSSSISQQDWNHHIFLLKTKLENFADFLAGRENFATEEWQPYRQIALKWKAQIDAGQWSSENSAMAKLRKENRDLKQRLHLHSETGFTSLHEIEKLESRTQEQTRIVNEKEKTIQQLQVELNTSQEKARELQTEIQTHLQALQTGQEWSQNQAKEIKSLQKQKQALTLLANSRKAQLEQEKSALIQLAHKKLTNQREAKQLLKELQEKWDQEKTELNQELTQTEQNNQNLTKDKKSLQETNQNQTQRILALEADKSELIQQLTNQKQKHQNHLTKEKSLLKKEIQLIKEVLHD